MKPHLNLAFVSRSSLSLSEQQIIFCQMPPITHVKKGMGGVGLTLR